jgi:ribonuclease E
MANKMLIDAIHPEETRVVVLRGNRVEEFDFESASRKQLRGNIYLAKVTRVEPSLQAAFVDYGGNRHGFLAFSEIHPDYYQIPVADRQALIEEDARAQRDDDDDDDRGRRRNRHRHRGARRPDRDVVKSDELATEGETRQDETREAGPADASGAAVATDDVADTQDQDRDEDRRDDDRDQPDEAPQTEELTAVAASDSIESGERPEGDAAPGDQFEAAASAPEGENGEATATTGETAGENGGATEELPHEDEVVEDVGGDADVLEEVPTRAPRYRRQYKIQEVIKRRQVMLVQVVKEERGTKGAALTTYLSLAGRYSVLMPNTARGGGISRKVTNSDDRRRMKEIAEALQVPDGMGVILRTAGANRTDQEVQRDFEYLLRLWETVRDLTLKSTAPCLVYEEGSLVKRSIRDLYHKDIDEIIVEGEAAHTEAREFMRMLMPSHANNVQLYHDMLPLFTRYGIETQLDAMFQPTVQLKSGGYIVINQTEALVAIDVNSGRSTREHSIEETALKTNSEASHEIARQLRLRDLAGLIVIDYIDMDEKRNNRVVERKLKDALKSDRARIQIGRISHFGLMEMSRQRIRTSVLESSTETCPHCGGTGHVRSVSSVALQLLRAIDETLMKGATHNLIVRTRSDVAIYVLNNKRAHLRRLEERFKVTITITTDPTMTGQPAYAIDRGEQVMSVEQAKALAAQFESDMPRAPEPEPVSDEIDETDEMQTATQSEYGEREDRERPGRRGRRGRRGRGRGGERDQGPRDQGRGPRDQEQPAIFAAGDAAAESEEFGGVEDPVEETDGAPMQAGAPREGGGLENGDRKRRRRGRRGGRRNRRHREGNGDMPEGAPESGAESYERDGADDVSSPVSSPSHQTEAPAPSAPRDDARLPEPVYAAPAPEVSAEAPRRRSTVREPAPGFAPSSADTPPPVASPPPPAPEPAAQGSSEEAAKPRRAGWWSKRS